MGKGLSYLRRFFSLKNSNLYKEAVPFTFSDSTTVEMNACGKRHGNPCNRFRKTVEVATRLVSQRLDLFLLGNESLLSIYILNYIGSLMVNYRGLSLMMSLSWHHLPHGFKGFLKFLVHPFPPLLIENYSESKGLPSVERHTLI